MYQAFESLPNVETVTCFKGTVDGTKKSTTWTVRFSSFLNAFENNLFSHDGNPSINQLACKSYGMVAAGGGTASCVIAAFDHSLSTSGTYSGGADADYVVEVLDDTADPNTYRWKKDGGSWTTANMESSAHPVGGLGAEGVQLTFTSTVGHTSGAWWSFSAASSDGSLGDITFQSTVREWALCSNRGVCDENLGSCTCFDGWGTCGRAIAHTPPSDLMIAFRGNKLRHSEQQCLCQRQQLRSMGAGDKHKLHRQCPVDQQRERQCN